MNNLHICCWLFSCNQPLLRWNNKVAVEPRVIQGDRNGSPSISLTGERPWGLWRLPNFVGPTPSTAHEGNLNPQTNSMTACTSLTRNELKFILLRKAAGTLIQVEVGQAKSSDLSHYHRHTNMPSRKRSKTWAISNQLLRDCDRLHNNKEQIWQRAASLSLCAPIDLRNGKCGLAHERSSSWVRWWWSTARERETAARKNATANS